MRDQQRAGQESGENHQRREIEGSLVWRERRRRRRRRRTMKVTQRMTPLMSQQQRETRIESRYNSNQSLGVESGQFASDWEGRMLQRSTQLDR